MKVDSTLSSALIAMSNDIVKSDPFTGYSPLQKGDQVLNGGKPVSEHCLKIAGQLIAVRRYKAIREAGMQFEPNAQKRADELSDFYRYGIEEDFLTSLFSLQISYELSSFGRVPITLRSGPDGIVAVHSANDLRKYRTMMDEFHHQAGADIENQLGGEHGHAAQTSSVTLEEQLAGTDIPDEVIAGLRQLLKEKGIDPDGGGFTIQRIKEPQLV